MNIHPKSIITMTKDLDDLGFLVDGTPKGRAYNRYQELQTNIKEAQNKEEKHIEKLNIKSNEYKKLDKELSKAKNRKKQFKREHGWLQRRFLVNVRAEYRAIKIKIEILKDRKRDLKDEIHDMEFENQNLSLIEATREQLELFKEKVKKYYSNNIDAINAVRYYQEYFKGHEQEIAKAFNDPFLKKAIEKQMQLLRNGKSLPNGMTAYNLRKEMKDILNDHRKMIKGYQIVPRKFSGSKIERLEAEAKAKKEEKSKREAEKEEKKESKRKAEKQDIKMQMFKFFSKDDLKFLVKYAKTKQENDQNLSENDLLMIGLEEVRKRIEFNKIDRYNNVTQIFEEDRKLDELAKSYLNNITQGQNDNNSKGNQKQNDSIIERKSNRCWQIKI